MMNEFKKDLLRVKIADTREEMGIAASRDIVEQIQKLQAEKTEINIIFAAAPSQNEVLKNLSNSHEIDWTKINAFHMDEYIGLPKDAPQRFGNFLKNAIFSRVPFRSVHYIKGEAEEIETECKRYSELLKKYPVDIVCMGVGENGHIAFNDPPVADFHDPEVVKRVKLDPICRQQQVNDGCFANLGEVPEYALTLTVPALMSAQHLFCIVPGPTKAAAVGNMLNGEITTSCPASILRSHKSAILYCDADSSSKI